MTKIYSFNFKRQIYDSNVKYTFHKNISIFSIKHIHKTNKKKLKTRQSISLLFSISSISKLMQSYSNAAKNVCNNNNNYINNNKHAKLEEN